MTSLVVLPDKIEQWPTAGLVPYARNSRTHSDAQVAQIAASIAEFGFTNPILAGSDGVIVAGHRGLLLRVSRLETGAGGRARSSARRDAAPGIARTTASPRTPAGTMQCCESRWKSPGRLTSTCRSDRLRCRCARRLDGGRRTGAEGEPTTMQYPGQRDRSSRPGDVWLLGGHRLLCGDSTVAGRADRVLDGEPVDMVFTDPPYNVNYANSAKDKMRGKDRAILNDNLGDGFTTSCLAALTPTIAHCRGGIYVAMSSSELDVLQARSRSRRQVVDVHHLGQEHLHAGPRRLPAPVRANPVRMAGGRTTPLVRDRDQGDVWIIKKPQKNDLHPTMKPVELVERAIRNSSRPGNVVLDPVRRLRHDFADRRRKNPGDWRG